MRIEKYKIEEYNQSLLAEHKRKFDFVAAGIKNIEPVFKSLSISM
jgi:L-rhamnose isomerase/sugar isomerase